MALPALVVLASCASSSERGAAPDAPTPVKPARRAAPDEVVAACAKHLLLLHRERLAVELGAMAKLAGPPPTAAEHDESRRRLDAIGIAGAGRDRADSFANLAAPALSDTGHAFISWTPDPADVGLAKVRSRRPGQWKELWGRALVYEVLVLDGFVVPDYPAFREVAIDHKEGPRASPRRRSSLVWIDAATLERERQAIASDSSIENADARNALARIDEGAVLREMELREAAYLRLQDEVAGAARLDEAATWIEVQQGEPDLALASALLCAGDLPEERRRQKAVQSIFAKLAVADQREERNPLLTMPRDQRARRLKELAPYYVRAAIEGR